MLHKPLMFFLCVASLLGGLARGKEIRVSTDLELAKSIRQARAGDVVLIESGIYQGGLTFVSLKGSEKEPIIIRSKSLEHPAVISGGKEGIKFSGCSHVVIQGLSFVEQRENAINIDDEVLANSPRGQSRSEGMVLKGLVFRLQPKNDNIDAIKLSGIKNFLVEDCHVVGWSSIGCGIDMVACQEGVIQGCYFDGQNLGGVGIQAKGGSESIKMIDCIILNAVDRGIQVGGKTGQNSFRDAEATFEAKNVEVTRCTILGCETSIAMNGCLDVRIQLSRFLFPKRWFFKAIRENRSARFQNTARCTILENICVAGGREFVGSLRLEAGVARETLEFQSNVWSYVDSPRRDLRFGLPTHDRKGRVADQIPAIFLNEDLDWSEARFSMVHEHLDEDNSESRQKLLGSFFGFGSAVLYSILFVGALLYTIGSKSDKEAYQPRRIVFAVSILSGLFLILLMMMMEFDIAYSNPTSLTKVIENLFHPSDKLTQVELLMSTLDGAFVFLLASILCVVPYIYIRQKRLRLIGMSVVGAMVLMVLFSVKLFFFSWLGVDGFASVYFLLVGIPLTGIAIYSWHKEGLRWTSKIYKLIQSRAPIGFIYVFCIGLGLAGFLAHLVLGGARFDSYLVGSRIRHQYWNWSIEPFRYGWKIDAAIPDILIAIPGAALVWKWFSVNRLAFFRMLSCFVATMAVAFVLECLKSIEVFREPDLGYLVVSFVSGFAVCLIMEFGRELLMGRSSVAATKFGFRLDWLAACVVFASWITSVISCL